jgi:hypothetical protein
MTRNRPQPTPYAFPALLVSLVALVVSGFAAGVSLWQYQAAVTHNKLSVKPHVAVTVQLEGGLLERTGMYISNEGLGPAIINTITVEVGGKSYDATNPYVWRNIAHDRNLEINCFRRGFAKLGSVLKAGEERSLLVVTQALIPVVGGKICHEELLQFLQSDGLKVRVDYASMYGDSWETIGDSWVSPGTVAEIRRHTKLPGEPPANDISMSMYNQIQTEMELPEVVRILGRPGTELSRMQKAEETTVVYQWNNSDWSSMSVTLENDRVISKFQFRLK